MERITELKFQKMTKEEMGHIFGGEDDGCSGCKGKNMEYTACTSIDGIHFFSVTKYSPTAWQKFWHSDSKLAQDYYCDEQDPPQC